MTRRAERHARGGFSLVELLIVVTIIGIVAGLALPSLRRAVDRADAVRVVADMATVRLAVMEMLTTTNTLPGASDWGVVPPALVDRLPGGFDFSYKDVEYAWAMLDANSLGAARDEGWVEMTWAYEMAAAPAPPRTPNSGSQGKGKGRPLDQDQAGEGSGGDEAVTNGDLASGSTVGVLWVRYGADSTIGQALQRHAGTSAFWTPTQMAFVVLQ